MRPIAAFRNNFVAGLLLVAPFVITAIVLEILSGWTLRFVNPVVQNTRLTQYTANVTLLAQLLAAILIAITIAVLGWLAQRSIGRRLFGTADRAVNLIPLVSVIYSSVRQMANSMVSTSSDFDRVVLLEYPGRTSTASGSSPVRHPISPARIKRTATSSTSISQGVPTRPPGGLPSSRRVRSSRLI